MSNELTPIQPQPQQQITLQDQMAFAKAVCQSDIIPTVYRGKPANILVAVGYGAPLGLTPMQSLQDISVINGKPTASASFIASHVRMAGHKLRINKDEKALSVTATIVRSDDPDYPISVTRDKAWAQQMGLLNKDNYRKQPLTMLTWRAITAVAREACPEILYGVQYSPDELHDLDTNNDVRAEVVDDEQQPSRQKRRGYGSRARQNPVEQAEQQPQACAPEHAEAIFTMLRDCGVASNEEAEQVLYRLTGKHGLTPRQVSRQDADNLLVAAPDFVKRKIMQALQEIRKPQQEQVEVVETTTAEQENTDSKEAE
ncbi:hypothetical protein ACR73I_08100 [Bifidobacterium pseudocatenulatum]|jgi:hypothetical protein|uniref:hypothetical protein n=1 Tax=Bifidobacterium TaxID=1678 RepID=UPI0012602F04|nr:hypothetical protein [Bifidobacterium catenulatum]KAB7462195.1 hypothetical protein GBA80_08670 [Bifidobacterium catenulatum]